MANYKEANESGTSHIRCSKINIVNPYNLNPSIEYTTERVVTFGNRETIEPVGFLVVPFSPSKEIPLLDPTTGLATGGVVTMGEAYAILYSAFIQADIEAELAANNQLIV